MIRIDSASAKKHALDLIASLPENGEYMVSLGLYEKIKTREQRNYAHMCIGIIAKHRGVSLEFQKDEIIEGLEFAYRSGCSRLVRFVDWLVKYMPEAEALRSRILALPLVQRSTESYTKQEYAAFIDKIFEHAAKYGIQLPVTKGMDC